MTDTATFPKIRTYADIVSFARGEWRHHYEMETTYQLIQSSAAHYGGRPAISFLPKGDGRERNI